MSHEKHHPAPTLDEVARAAREVIREVETAVLQEWRLPTPLFVAANRLNDLLNQIDGGGDRGGRAST